MKKRTLTLFVILITSNIFSQLYKNMTVYKKDNSQSEVYARFIFENSLIKGIESKSKTSLFKIDDISKIIIKDKLYTVKEYAKDKYLFQQIIEGNLSLYKDKEQFYLENAEYKLRVLPLKKDILTKVLFEPGTISVFVNKCNSTANYLHNKNFYLSLSKLKEIIAIYNTCSVQEEIQVSKKIITESNRKDQKLQFGASIGLMNLNINLDNFQNTSSENMSTISIGGKLYFMANSKNKGLNLNLAINYLLGSKKQINIEQNSTIIIIKTQFISALFGVNYSFGYLKENFNPYVGISAGTIFNSRSYVNYVSRSGIVRYYGVIQYVYQLNAGAIINLFDKKIDFTLIYQPTKKMSLSSKNIGTSITNSYDVSALNLRLTYIF